MKKLLLLTLICLVGQLAFAQPAFVHYDSIRVVHGGDTLANPWAGGLNSAQFSSMDVNQDGKDDLFVFDRDGDVTKIFLNVGNSGQSKYRFDHQYVRLFPQMQNFALARDYDCDGHQDIFSFAPGGMKVYGNKYETYNSLVFAEDHALVYYEAFDPPLINLYVASTDVPSITDIDNDGDLDVLSFDVLGNGVNYYQNQAVERNGSCGTLEFTKAETCWGSFLENGSDNSVTLNVSCKTNETTDNQDTDAVMHTGSTILAIDLDGDADKDLLLGDVSYNNIVMLENGGDVQSAHMTDQEMNFPQNNVPIDLPIFPACFYVDVNNDGKRDLIAGPNVKNAAENYGSVWMYQNNGTDADPTFNLTQPDFLQSQMIEVGAGANPVFFDENGDGLMDLVVGNYGVYNSGDFEGKLALYRNIGTAVKPIFELVTDNYLDLLALNKTGFYPAFGDIDNDNDLDLIFGDADGKLNFYKNTAGAGNQAQFTQIELNYAGIDVGQFATPQLFDVDNDGDLDLIIGERSGNINFCENEGTASTAAFSNVITNQFFGEIDVMVPCCTGYSSVYLTKDSQNETIMYVGSEDGVLFIYDDIDNNLPNAFNKRDSLMTYGFRVNANGADLDNDGVEEIVYGEWAGGVGLYKWMNQLKLVSPPDEATNVNDNVMLDWSSVEGVDIYEYELDTVLTFDSPEYLTGQHAYISLSGDNQDTEYQTSNLLHGKTYYWRVRTIVAAVGQEDTSAWTAPRSFTVADDGTGLAGDTNGNNVYDGGEVNGDTDGNGTIDGGEIFGDSNGNGTIDTGELAGDTDGNGVIDGTEIAGDTDGNGVIDNGEFGGDVNGDGVPNGGEIQGDANGNGVLDDGEVFSVAEVKSMIDLQVYPNPAIEMIHFSSSKGIENVAIYDLTGQLVKSHVGDSNTLTIPRSELANGTYFYRATVKGELKIGKLVLVGR